GLCVLLRLASAVRPTLRRAAVPLLSAEQPFSLTAAVAATAAALPRDGRAAGGVRPLCAAAVRFRRTRLSRPVQEPGRGGEDVPAQLRPLHRAESLGGRPDGRAVGVPLVQLRGL